MLISTRQQIPANAGFQTDLSEGWLRSFRRIKAFQSPLSERRTLLVLGDISLVFLVTYLATAIITLWQSGWADFNLTNIAFPWGYALLFAGGWEILAILNDLYDIPSSHDLLLTSKRVFVLGLISAVSYYFISLSIRSLPSDELFLLFLFILLPAILGWRTMYTQLSKIFLPFYQRVIILGSGERAKVIGQTLQYAQHLNYDVLGYVDDTHLQLAAQGDQMPLLCDTQNLTQLVKERHVHQIIVALDQHLDHSLFHLLVECQSNGTMISWMPDLYSKIYRRVPVEHVDPDWGLLAMQDRPIFQRLQLALKRSLDLLICLLAWPLLLIALPVIALAIYVDSPGPIFYQQIRCGRGGKPFSIFKFRTMETNAESDGKARWATKSDKRITRVGKFLRKSRLDELPQIINILRGDMSIVGPRPERPEFVQLLEKEIPLYRTRLMVKPGLTGWAQVHYDYGNSVEDALIKLQYDFYYVRYWAFWLDLYILFRTISVIAKLKGT